MKAQLSSVLAAAVGVVSLAACSTQVSSPGASSTAQAKATAAATGGGAKTVKAIDVCQVLPAAEAAKLSGQPYTVAAEAAQGWTSGCAYDNDDATVVGVNVNVDTSDAAANTWADVDKGDKTDISGLGDKAFWDNDNTLYAMTGAALIQVNGLESQDKAVALAKVVIGALQ